MWILLGRLMRERSPGRSRQNRQQQADAGLMDAGLLVRDSLKATTG